MTLVAVTARREARHEFCQLQSHKAVKEPVAERAPSTPAEVTDYSSLIICFRERADELGISRNTIDEIAGIANGLSSKILGLGHVRGIGLRTLGPMLDVLCLKLIAVPDEAALARNRSRLVPRIERNVRYPKAKTEHDRAVQKFEKWCAKRGLTVTIGYDTNRRDPESIAE
jgi:hypothetical protein